MGSDVVTVNSLWIRDKLMSDVGGDAEWPPRTPNWFATFLIMTSMAIFLVTIEDYRCLGS